MTDTEGGKPEEAARGELSSRDPGRTRLAVGPGEEDREAAVGVAGVWPLPPSLLPLRLSVKMLAVVWG